MSCHISRRDKINELVRELKDKNIKTIENNDPQFLALKKLSFRVSSEFLVKSSIANALITYQLSGKGEDYWQEFADGIEEGDLYKSIIKFLENSKNNRRLLNEKKKRLKKAIEYIDGVKIADGCLEIWNKIAKMGKEKKTTVFAVKIFGYVKRIINERFCYYPMEIPLPIDSRIKIISKRFVVGDDKCIQKFWQEIAELSNIPPLHIDSILWLGKLHIKEQ